MKLLETHYNVFKEAQLDEVTRSVRVILITEGLGNSRDRNYYTAESLQQAVAEGIFEGAQCFLNHPSISQQRDLPERDVRELVGHFGDVKLESVKSPDDTMKTVNAITATLSFDGTPSGNTGYELAKSAIRYAQKYPDKVYAGFSINADGITEPGTDEDGSPRNNVQKFTSAFSVDLVTKPARGGKVLAFTESLVESVRGAINKLTESHIQKRRMSFIEKAMMEEILAHNSIMSEKTPEGYENVVKALKGKPEITNPWAVAWWMKSQGYTPKEAIEECSKSLEAMPSTAFGVTMLKSKRKV